jgi:hypothetical protein
LTTFALISVAPLKNTFHVDGVQNRLVAVDHLEPGGRECGGWRHDSSI